MSSTIRQGDVPEDVLAGLRQQAAIRGASPSSYVRELLADEAQQENTDEIIKCIATQARQSAYRKGKCDGYGHAR